MTKVMFLMMTKVMFLKTKVMFLMMRMCSTTLMRDVNVNGRPSWASKAERARSASLAFQNTSTWASAAAAVQDEWDNGPMDEPFVGPEEDSKPAAKPKVPHLNF